MAFKFKPYFMQDKKWYFYNEEEKKYELTDEAPEEAVKSYIDFYQEDDNVEEDMTDYSDEAMSLFGLQGGQNNGMQQ